MGKDCHSTLLWGKQNQCNQKRRVFPSWGGLQDCVQWVAWREGRITWTKDMGYCCHYFERGWSWCPVRWIKLYSVLIEGTTWLGFMNLLLWSLLHNPSFVLFLYFINFVNGYFFLWFMVEQFRFRNPCYRVPVCFFVFLMIFSEPCAVCACVKLTMWLGPNLPDGKIQVQSGREWQRGR